jgi:hypothetical protein
MERVENGKIRGDTERDIYIEALTVTQTVLIKKKIS